MLSVSKSVCPRGFGIVSLKDAVSEACTDGVQVQSFLLAIPLCQGQRILRVIFYGEIKMQSDTRTHSRTHTQYCRY